MKKLYVLPFSVIFVTPWMHRLAYENIKVAMPMYQNPDGVATTLAVVAMLVGMIVTVIVLDHR